MRHGTHVISAKCVSKCFIDTFYFIRLQNVTMVTKLTLTLKNLLPDYGLSILYLWYLINTFIAAHLSLRRRLHSIYQNELKMFESISRITIPCITPSIVVSSSLKSFSEFLLNKWHNLFYEELYEYFDDVSMWLLWWSTIDFSCYKWYVK